MTTMQERKTERAERLNKLPALIEATIRAAEDVPDHELGLFYNLLDPGEIRVDLPRAKGLVTEYLKMIAKQGSWRRDGRSRNPERLNGDLYYMYLHRELNVELTICFDAEHKGATCRLEQTGVKEVPVFKVVCDDPDTL